jgi:hypothetical protein
VPSVVWLTKVQHVQISIYKAYRQHEMQNHEVRVWKILVARVEHVYRSLNMCTDREKSTAWQAVWHWQWSTRCLFVLSTVESRLIDVPHYPRRTIVKLYMRCHQRLECQSVQSGNTGMTPVSSVPGMLCCRRDLAPALSSSHTRAIWPWDIAGVLHLLISWLCAL